MSIYQPKVNPRIYGLHIPYDKGYDATSQRKYPAAEMHAPSGYFARADGTRIELWITEVSADFSVSGQTGQSRMVREFFPRSFNDVTLTISGNVSGTREYNRLGTFVREAHWRALQSINQGSTADPTITFGLYDSPGHDGRKPFDNLRRNTKGSHRPWQVQGYVKNMAAGATTQEVAPEFSIAFIVTESLLKGNTGLWSDAAAVAPHLQNFLQIVSRAEKIYHGSGFTQNPVTALLPRQQPLRTAAQDVQGVLQDTKQGAWSIAAALTALGL